ncbi:MAG: hypothetical protein ACM32E_20590 [Gemmatimonadota bacterium]
MAQETETARSDALRRIRYQLSRCEDALDLAHMTLLAVSGAEQEWAQQFRLDMEVLRCKLTLLASLVGPGPDPQTGESRA